MLLPGDGRSWKPAWERFGSHGQADTGGELVPQTFPWWITEIGVPRPRFFSFGTIFGLRAAENVTLLETVTGVGSRGLGLF